MLRIDLSDSYKELEIKQLKEKNVKMNQEYLNLLKKNFLNNVECMFLYNKNKNLKTKVNIMVNCYKNSRKREEEKKKRKRKRSNTGDDNKKKKKRRKKTKRDMVISVLKESLYPMDMKMIKRAIKLKYNKEEQSTFIGYVLSTSWKNGEIGRHGEKKKYKYYYNGKNLLFF
jgi:hypothetical protein